MNGGEPPVQPGPRAAAPGPEAGDVGQTPGTDRRPALAGSGTATLEVPTRLADVRSWKIVEGRYRPQSRQLRVWSQSPDLANSRRLKTSALTRGGYNEGDTREASNNATPASPTRLSGFGDLAASHASLKAKDD